MAKKNNNVKKFSFFLNGKFDFPLLIITIFLLIFGLIMLLSASTPTSISEDGVSYKYVLRQGEVVLFGLVLMIILSKIDYRIYKNFKWIIYIATVVLLIAVGLTGTSEGGARRWIYILGFSFQPSEFAKIAFVIFFAALLSELKEKNKIKKFVPGFCYPLIFLLPVVYAIFKLQNHFSATFIIGLVTLIQIFVAGASMKYFFLTGSAGIIGVLAYVLKKIASPDGDGFRLGRIHTWLNIESDLTGAAWQINQSLYAIGSGGLFGVGLGNSKQKYLYIPEPHNDFIFAVLAEEFGFLGCITVITLFALFVWRGIVIAMKSQDTFGTLIAIGLTSIIGLQSLINVAVVTNTIPVTGMPLPFFSYGGSAMLANLIGVGILLSVSRNSIKTNNN